MPGNNFVVNYDINVLSADAVAGINSFVAATKKLQNASANFNKLNSQINNIKNRFAALSQKAPTIQIKTADAERKLDRLIGKLTQLERKAKSAGIALGTTGVGAATNPTPAAPAGGGRRVATPIRQPRQSLRSIRHNALGLTNIDTGGVGAFDFLKGMGIAYGISGLGTLVSNTVKEAVEYDNMIQTAKNILKSHDHGPDFNNRFKNMERVVRQVGIETKYTAPEVADAAKFLAMAGFNIDDINKSIRPIADIALVGDTELGETADVVTNIMTGYGISPDRVREAADIMTMTFTKSNTTLLELAEAYKYAGSLLSLNGTSFEEASAALGILGDAGIKGSQAGTTMRTLALNIAKPTKGQAEAWEALGISRYDKDGKLRNLSDIFQDLHDKNLSLDQLGKLFHKTAASGGAALAAHVEKWNEIIRLNFMSDGMVSKLAEEKKNTVEGLWKQVTSSLTEAGMKAFEDHEGAIKNLLNRAIGWLQSDEGVADIKGFANTVGHLMGTIGEISIKLYNIFKKFEKPLMLWLEFQAKMSVALIPIRYTRAIFDLGKYFLTLSRHIGAASASLTKFANLPAWIRLARMKGISGKNILPTMARTSMGRGLGIGAGAIAGGFIGDKIGGDGMMGPLLGSLIGGGIGMFAPQILSFMSAVPVVGTILAAMTAIGIGVGVWVKHKKAVEEATIAQDKFFESIKTINGISYAEGASEMDKYLQILRNKQLSVNEVLAEYIKLRKEELGLINNKPQEEIKLKDHAKYKSLYDLIQGKGLRQLNALATNGEVVNGESISGNGWYGYNWRGREYRTGMAEGMVRDKSVASAVLLARGLYGLGADVTPGTATYDLRENLLKNLLKVDNMSDWDAAVSNFTNSMTEKNSKAILNSYMWTYSNLDDLTNSKIELSTDFLAGQKDVLTDWYNNPEGVVQTYLNFLKTPGGYKNASEGAILKLLTAISGQPVFGEEFGKWGTPEWYRKFGYYDGKWNAITFGDQTLTAEQAKNNFELFRAAIAQSIRALSPNIRDMLTPYLADNIWRPEEIAKLKIGEESWVDGEHYTWDGKLWQPNKLSTAAVLSYGQMEALKQKNAAPTTGDSGTTTTTANDYDTPYKSSSVTPKQIIVKIENLMNVESVDMSNPNNAAVIEDLRNQMAQALIDVVADFDANANA